MMSTTGTFFTPSDLLGKQTTIESLIKTAKQYETIRHDCQKLMPTWFKLCQILRLENGILTIGTPNQTLAARIRMNIPLLQSGLNLKGWNITHIRLKINFKQEPPQKTKPSIQSRRLSPHARACFNKLYTSLQQDNDHSSLLQSLHHMLNKQ